MATSSQRRRQRSLRQQEGKEVEPSIKRPTNSAEVAPDSGDTVRTGPQSLTDASDKPVVPYNEPPDCTRTEIKDAGQDGAPSGVAVEDERCDVCLQFLNDANFRMYSGDPPDAVEELEMLIDPRMGLGATAMADCDAPLDCVVDRPDLQVALFSVYDKYNHLCPFDDGMIERDEYLWFSGVVRQLGWTEGGVVTKRIGPIVEWWISGYERQNPTLGFTTAYADYALSDPSPEYLPYIRSAWEKIHVSKSVVEFVAENRDATFADLLDHVQNVKPPLEVATITQDTLFEHAQFVVDQIASFDSTADVDDALLMTTNCIRGLIRMAKVSLHGWSERKRRHLAVKTAVPKKAATTTDKDSKATTTPLVHSVIGDFFPHVTEIGSALQRKERCGVCAGCLRPDCGRCGYCKSRRKRTAAAKKHTDVAVCAAQVCLNVAVQEADEDDAAEEEDDFQNGVEESPRTSLSATPPKQGGSVTSKTTVAWTHKPAFVKDQRKYYDIVHINALVLQCGDHVLVQPLDGARPPMIARVVRLFEDESGAKMFHAHWYVRGTETILGETSDRWEVFVVDDCADVALQSVVGGCAVIRKTIPSNWSSLGGVKNFKSDDVGGAVDCKTFFFQKWYDLETASFEDLPAVPDDDSCGSCHRADQKRRCDAPQFGRKLPEGDMRSKRVGYASVTWKGIEYRVDDCVFLRPEALSFVEYAASLPSSTSPQQPQAVDETLYPEYYRKSECARGAGPDVPEPFCVTRILSITTAPWRLPDSTGADQVRIKVEVFYRPENTHLGRLAASETDANLLYWTNEVTEVRLSDCVERCSVVYCKPDHAVLRNFTLVGPVLFYFHQSYDSASKTFGAVPRSVALLFRPPARPLPPPSGRRLRGMDIFAGCGGLSAGFHQVGLMDALWAVEREKAAAQAFAENNPQCTVFQEDCNRLLKLVMEGRRDDGKGHSLPQKGDVDIIIGGPPCQGFSGMNRFNHRQYSLFKNSLIATFLSYCDYFRPRFVVMENVRNFALFQRGMVLKLALRCLVRMGYQCRFGVLQAGNYGVAQTRRRVILLAAAPGEILPLYPEPSTVFTERLSHLAVVVDNCRYSVSQRRNGSAPYRAVTVRDSTSDLPTVDSGATGERIAFAAPPKTSFQKVARRNIADDDLRDHVCKGMSPLVVARMKYLPHSPGADWRDLPNLVVDLGDRQRTSLLEYTHDDVKNGRSSTGALRGVCPCAEGRQCDPRCRQVDTLIPWCLPHTGNRHNHWAGLYGRLNWDGFFPTTVTNPEPMGKQGSVVHPEQDRVVSVRECARSQGFPDSYRFCGGVLDRYRQIGNAVPPPLAAAIAYEILKCLGHTSSCPDP